MGPVWARFIQSSKILLHSLLVNGTCSGVTMGTQSPQLRGGGRTGGAPDGSGEEKTINVSHK